MKKLLASGCSWTDTNFKSVCKFLPDEKRGGWPMWPEIMGKELGLEAINTGHMGRGNVYISQSIIDNIIKYGNEVEMVAVLWTEVARYDSYNETAINLQHLQVHDPRWSQIDLGLHASYNSPFDWNIDDFTFNDVYNTWNNNTLRAMYTVAEMCTHRNIKCIFDQGVVFFWHAEFELLKSLMHKDMFISELDYMTMLENNELYQRLMKDYGHLFVNPKVILNFEHTVGYLIHNRNDLKVHWPDHLTTIPVKDFNSAQQIDPHPNGEGQKVISERYLQALK